VGDANGRWTAIVMVFWISTAALLAGPAAGQLPIGGPILVNSATQAGDQQGPSVGMADDGRLRVFWSDRSGNDVAQRGFAADGSPFAASAPNQTDNGEREAFGSVNGSNDWIVAWGDDQQTGGGLDLFARRSSNNGGTLAGEFQVNETADANVLTASRLSRADDDSFVAAWIDFLAPGDLQFRKFALNGSAVTGDLLANESSDPELADFSIAAAPNGSFLIAWQAGAAFLEQVYARCFDANGVALGPQFIVPADQPTRNFSPLVAVDALGYYVVAWLEGGSADLEWRRFGPDCLPRGGDRLAIAGGTSGTRDPALDMARDGAIVFAWSSKDIDPDEGISVLEMTKSGAIVGGEFLAHEIAAGLQLRAGAAIGDRLFAVVWQDEEGTNSGDDDIFLQRFVRRVVFTDDFENEGTDYWSAVAP